MLNEFGNDMTFMPTRWPGMIRHVGDAEKRKPTVQWVSSSISANSVHNSLTA